MSQKKNITNISASSNYTALEAALVSTLQPLASALDAEHFVESGQETPSSQDKGLRILLDYVCNHLHRQARGAIVTRAGTIPNALERMHAAEENMRKLQAKYAGDTDAMIIDPEFHRQANYLSIAEERFNTTIEMCDAFATVYKHFTKEDWAPMEQQNVPQVKPVEVSDAKKKQLLEMMERLKEKDARAASISR